MRKRKQEWREAEVQGESGERGREVDGQSGGGRGGDRREGVACQA